MTNTKTLCAVFLALVFVAQPEAQAQGDRKSQRRYTELPYEAAAAYFQMLIDSKKVPPPSVVHSWQWPEGRLAVFGSRIDDTDYLLFIPVQPQIVDVRGDRSWFVDGLFYASTDLEVVDESPSDIVGRHTIPRGWFKWHVSSTGILLTAIPGEGTELELVFKHTLTNPAATRPLKTLRSYVVMFKPISDVGIVAEVVEAEPSAKVLFK